MGYSSLYLFMFMHYIFFLPSCFHLIILTNSSSSKLQAHLCLDDERFALLHFNQSLSHDESASGDPSAYPKVASWKLERDCCSWDGVECDGNTGHVIGLDLSSSFLYGSINSSSSLFSLVHLRRLNLADNHFNYSQIPSGISHLLRLSSLDLSGSVFSGQIPSQILGLSSLVSLNLCCNVDPLSGENLLKLETPCLRSLVQNLTNLKELSLSNVNISSTVPHTLANLSSLTSLSLDECLLHGQFPADIFHLPKLQVLSMQLNENLNGYLPEFYESSPLKILNLAGTSFSGKLPDSIGNLNSLYQLDLRDCFFSGSLQPSLGNLTILTHLHLSSNLLQGPIPCSFSKLQNLVYLYLGSNNLSGTVEANIFFNLQKLTDLSLSGNNLTFVTNNITYATLPKFRLLGLISCNLREFPYFLRFQDELEVLNLSENYIHGQIPEWMWNISKETLVSISIHHNFLTGFDQLPTILPWVGLGYIDLRHNMLRGSLPIPPPNVLSYSVSNNSLTGNIPLQICHMSTLYALDLSNNDMSGTIPPCIGNFSSSLSVLNLKGNNFLGTIPETYTNGSNLRVVDLSQNQLEGKIPRSLENCTKLEILNLGENQMEDTFPFWLGALSELQILILRSNKFHGTIETRAMNIGFPKLRIIDLSNNGFTGSLPLEYFQNLNGMKIDHVDLAYMQATISILVRGTLWDTTYPYTMSITNKGVKIEYEKILNIFTAADLSSNKFIGEIPESIENLKGLQLLNLSNNELFGQIPPSLGSLSNLESLDLSQNKLLGEIPQQLEMLNFLAFLNVSYNNLIGPIPRGKQFDTFQNNSYEENFALCGEPLSKPCQDLGTSTSPPTSTFEQDDDSKFPSGVDWIFVFMGVGSGLVVGFVFGQYITARNHEWFMEKFGKRKLYWRRRIMRE